MKSFKSSIRSSVSLAIILALATITIAFAASGDLDTTFSGDGKILQYFGEKGNYGSDLAIQSDGKVVVAGYTQDARVWHDRDIVVARYDVNGSLDTTFSGDGWAVVRIPNQSLVATAVAIQSDGKIVVGGSASYYVTDLILIRFNPDGSLDTSFNGDGIAIVDADGKYNDCIDIVIQGTRIYVAGNYVDMEKDLQDGIVYRFNKNGYLDKTFSKDGFLIVNFGKYDELYALQLNSGKIYVTGTTSNTAGINYDLIVARYNDNGLPDFTFSDDGRIQTSLGGSDVGYDLVINNGKTIVVGISTDSFGNRGKMFLVQYTASGELDLSFGTNGKVVTYLNFEEPALEGVIIRDGKIIAVGRTNDQNHPTDTLLVRYDANGNLDTTFGAGGIVTTTWPGVGTYYSVAAKNARIYAVGYYMGKNGTTRLILAAYKP